MATLTAILMAVVFVILLAKKRLRLKNPAERFNNRDEEKSIQLAKSRPFVCGTPHLQNGGRLIIQTGNIIEIVSREGTQTMTIEEYESRQLNITTEV